MNISPSEQERRKVNKIADELVSKLNIKDASAILGGSGAKNTWLPGTHDIDIYVKFNYDKHKNKSDKLSDILYPFLKRKFKVTRLHGSRDYFKVNYKGYNIEIIPILDISTHSEAKNITDISPLHITWVNNNIKNLADDIRKAKQFCKANNLYGAESYIQGFSGYSLEILVIHYGSFDKLLEAASKWKPKEVIDTKKYHKDAFEALNIAKLQSPLILIDPVQPDRNAAAALSFEKYERFKQLAVSYLKKPSQDYFRQKTLSKKEISKKYKNKVIMLHASLRENDKPDVAGAKVLKLFNNLGKSLVKNEFVMLNADIQFSDNNALFYYVTENKKLSKLRKHYGPPIDNEKHLIMFKKRWKGYDVKLEGNKSYVMVKREFTDPLSMIKHEIKQKEMKQLASGIKIK